MPKDDFPLRVDGITAAWSAERRPQDVIPPNQSADWQMVYVRSGTIEERCDDRRVLLRAGGILFHQPAETFGMRPLGEVPPEVMRLDFICGRPDMDRFRGAVFHAEPPEQQDLAWLMDAVTEYFEAPAALGDVPQPKPDPPYGAQQQMTIHLENLLLMLARRWRRARRPGARLRRERSQAALVDAARLYFSQNLERELRVEEVCRAIGCTKPQLQAAFRNRLRHTAMEEFSAMRLDFAAQLLARGAAPGEVAVRLGYRSGAYFSQKFKAATGNTPSAYRRMQQGLPARRQNRQQKDKAESKTSMAETPQRK